jgi:HK97 family phage major capsid protein
MTQEEKAAHDALIANVKSVITGEMDITKKELEGLKADLKSAEAKINDDATKNEVIRLASELKALKEFAPVAKEDLSVKGQIASFFKANHEKWEAFKRGETTFFGIKAEKGQEAMAAIQIKAAGTMLETTNLGSSAYLPVREVVAGYTEIAANKPLIENFANTSATSSSNIVWVNMVNRDGAAAITAEGAVKPLVDFEFETESSQARKVAGKIKISTEMLDDIDFVAAAIENELRYQVDMAVDAGLLTGDGTGVNLKGITEYAPAFVLTTLESTTPKKGDAIIAAAAQIKSLNFNATHAFVNTIDEANMMLEKDSTGQPIINRLAELGLTVVASNNITVGYVLVADMSKYIVRNYKPFAISFGYVNDDFEKNLVTVIGERRLHAYASDNNTNAFVYDTFDNIITAITVV